MNDNLYDMTKEKLVELVVNTQRELEESGSKIKNLELTIKDKNRQVTELKTTLGNISKIIEYFI